MRQNIELLSQIQICNLFVHKIEWVDLALVGGFSSCVVCHTPSQVLVSFCVHNSLFSSDTFSSHRYTVPKIQEVGTEVEAEYLKLAPPLWPDIPKFSDICRQAPSGTFTWKYSYVKIHCFARCLALLNHVWSAPRLEIPEQGSA